jgi:hypothetical protein
LSSKTEHQEDKSAGQFAVVVDYMSRIDYRERRFLLWRQNPRYPRFLYKFRTLVPSKRDSVDRIRDILVRSRFWLSSPSDFNDPFDMSAKIIVQGTPKEKRTRIEKLLMDQGLSWSERKRQRPQLMARSDDEIAQVAQTQFEAAIRATGVYSFGGDPRNILMWSHYASNHQGICLQFEVAKDIRTFALVLTIRYRKDYPIVNWIGDFGEGMKTIIETKHEGWAYEKETRIMLPRAAKQYLDFRPEALCGIIIGSQATAAMINQLRELIDERDRGHMPKPILYRAYQHGSKYKLVIKKE